MITHHFSVVNSALVGVLCLDKDRQPPKKGPGFEVVFLAHVRYVETVCQKNGVFDQLLFGPLRSSGRCFHLASKRTQDLERL